MMSYCTVDVNVNPLDPDGILSLLNSDSDALQMASAIHTQKSITEKYIVESSKIYIEVSSLYVIFN